MKHNRPPIKASSTWACAMEGCADVSGKTFDEIVAHASQAHNALIRGKKCRKSMAMHLDCADSFHSNWEVEVEGIKLINCTSNPRKHDYYGADE